MLGLSSSSRGKLTASAIAISTTLLSLLILFPSSNSKTTVSHHRHELTELQTAIAAEHCEGTLYTDLCFSTVAVIPDLHTKSLAEVISSIISRTTAEVRATSRNCTSIEHQRTIDIRQRRALDDCLDLLDTTIDGFSTTLADLKNASDHRDDIQTLLSAAMTNQYTCLDGFADVKGGVVRKLIEKGIRHIDRLCSNSLAMAKKIPRKKKSKKRKGGRELIEGYGVLRNDGFPQWMTKKDRRLLQTAGNGTKADLVVAKDGSGNFTTVAAAVAAAPNKSKSRFVIHIKAGAYLENVEVGKSKTNIMFVGDGIGKTIIKAGRNVVDGWTTFRSATLAVVGNGFIAKGITVENSAGPSKHQAVALRSGSDLSAFYQCSFVGYQDTLYAHSLRQFYRECDIYGTVDFIFGNAAVVFQSCNLYARKPDPNQKNIYTAQGREDPNQNTGISIQNCKVTAASDLIPVRSQFKTYLGRPWKQYSRTIFMQSYLDNLIDPAGWLEWNETFALDTLYYREYKNTGPGANTIARVNWPGYKVITNATEATQFSVSNFIQGDLWLSQGDIPFSAGL